MKQSFFIYSLPRSGSTWLSVFLTGRDSFCYHDALGEMSASRLAEVMDARPESIVGAVETAAYQIPDQIRENFPRSRIFELSRDPNDIQESSSRYGVCYDAHEARRRMRAAVASGVFQRIHHHRFGDLGYLRDLWARVIGTPFDEERARMLIETRIERHVERFFSNRPHLRVACAV